MLAMGSAFHSGTDASLMMASGILDLFKQTLGRNLRWHKWWGMEDSCVKQKYSFLLPWSPETTQSFSVAILKRSCGLIFSEVVHSLKGQFERTFNCRKRIIWRETFLVHKRLSFPRSQYCKRLCTSLQRCFQSSDTLH